MPTIADALRAVKSSLPQGVELIAVSKTHPAELIREAYAAGQRHFGENKVQELALKAQALPPDIVWHMIGHLQTNKVKYIAPFVSYIHSVDSERVLDQIEHEAAKNGRIIKCLLQVHVAREETKFGFLPSELHSLLQSAFVYNLHHVRICGLMAMASNTDDIDQVRREFHVVQELFKQTKSIFFANDPSFCELSMGMSGDYKLAIDEGATMVRIGSSIFGQRIYNTEK